MSPLHHVAGLSLICLVCWLAPVFVEGRVDESVQGLDYYLPEGVTYDPSIPTPASVLGHEVGEWHVRHDMLVAYFRALAEASPRFTFEEYARSHERRPLFLCTVSSPANLARLEEIREAHVAAALGDADGDPDRPVVVWLGYSVHGNESSGANAALVAGYHLAAGTGAEMDRLLANAVILIDPCMNPDGLSRFAHWANVHRGKNLVGDPNHREHREVWPGGRTNHYWFDLNRDWLLLTHPESRGRLEKFHRWKPNVLTDFHEMGTNSTYFFQPGVPSRQNPNTPQANLDLTREIARFHARILDRAGSLYYTEESFDDFYYGKGSTYPDVNGCVGILFEQASSRGHLQESSFGPLTFPFTIRNQFLTSLSTLEAALDLRKKLLDFQQGFYRAAVGDAAKDPVRAYVVGAPRDPARMFHFLDIVRRHQIEVRRLAKPIRNEGRAFSPETSYVITAAQKQYHLIKGLFERRTKFNDDAFYDVSAWTLPLSFGLDFAELTEDEFAEDLLGDSVGTPEFPSGRLDATANPYAYLFEWHGYYAPRALQRLLDAKLKVRVAKLPFSAETENGKRDFDYGTILVPSGIQEIPRDEVAELMRTIAAEDAVDVFAVTTGLTFQGIDLGSPNMREVPPVEALMVVGSGVSGYEAGEAWHVLDTRYGARLSMVELPVLERADLDRYSHIVLVSGGYDLSEAAVERVRTWVRGGGVVVALRGATSWAERTLLGRTRAAPAAPAPAPDSGAEKSSSGDRPTYAQYEQIRARDRISGAIFEAEIDVTHPLGFGYTGPTIPVFKNSQMFMKAEEDPLATVVRYSERPLLAGYISDENLAKLPGVAVVSANRYGRGVVVRIADNPNFRGVWYGTNKLFANALYFARAIKSTGF